MDRTRELIKRVQDGDKACVEQLLSENMGLIWSIVRKFGNTGYEAEDLFQIGAIGLMKCIAKFDLSYDVKFSTYAVPMILGEIKRFIRDDGMIKVSRPLKEIAIKAKYAQDTFAKREAREPTITELAKLIDVSTEDLVLALEANMDVESLYAPIQHSDGGEAYLIDRLEQNQGSDGNMVDKIALKEIISHLKPKERQIIILRYFYDKTQTEIAKKIGISQVQVSRIEKKVLETIRASFCV